MSRSRFFWSKGAPVLLALLVTALPAAAQEGVLLSGAGPVNRSMGGASTAAPLDAIGALFWNPATISGLPQSEMDFGMELLLPRSTLSSSIPANALGPFVPPVSLAGSTGSNSGVFPLPSLGLAYKPECSDWTLGLGVFAIGGFSVNYPGSFTNPILTPQPPNGLGVGPLLGQMQVLQIAPSASYQLRDNLSVGFGPTVDLATLQVDPALITSPDNANGNGYPTYPAATHTRYSWGVGVQAGIFYTPADDWHLGASIKSPQWFEPFQYNSSNQLGQPRSISFDLDLPMIVSAGVSYTGFERWVLATDFRWLDYASTEGFRQSGFDATGALRGVGWRSIFAVAFGVQYALTDALLLRAGYTFNQNPIPAQNTSFNIAAPLIAQNTLSFGATYRISSTLNLSLAYLHIFQSSIEGPLISSAGVVPGSTVGSSISADSLVVGVSVLFGAPKGAAAPIPSAQLAAPVAD